MTDMLWLAFRDRFLQPPGRPVEDSEIKRVLTGKESNAESLSSLVPWAWLLPGIDSLRSGARHGVSLMCIPDEMLIPVEEWFQTLPCCEEATIHLENKFLFRNKLPLPHGPYRHCSLRSLSIVYILKELFFGWKWPQKVRKWRAWSPEWKSHPLSFLLGIRSCYNLP